MIIRDLSAFHRLLCFIKDSPSNNLQTPLEFEKKKNPLTNNESMAISTAIQNESRKKKKFKFVYTLCASYFMNVKKPL